MIWAAKNCDESSVKLLIAAGADVNIKNKNGFTALHVSVRNRSEKCAHSLVDAGADVNMEDSDYLTPVMEAVVFECRECLNLLLKAGADVDRYNIDGGGLFTPLLVAVELRNQAFVDLLIKAGADVNKHRLESPLMRSMTCSTIAITRMLTKAGADVNRKSAIGSTALMEAGTRRMKCAKRNIQLLLFEGARVNIFNSWNQNALLYHSVLREKFCKSNEDQSDFCAICLLLFAAGESTDVSPDGRPHLPLQTAINLKHLCREAIRKHLLKIDPHGNLFGRVPRLGLPTPLTSYLLYDATLDEDEEENEDDDDDNDDAMVPWREPHIKMRTCGIIRCTAVNVD